MMFDSIVIGGSFAGLSAALQLARAQRRVLLIDAGLRRNRFAKSAHGFFGFDGADPAQMQQQALAAVLAYPTVQYQQTLVLQAEQLAADGGFRIWTAAHEQFLAKTLILATGIIDRLPEIAGLAERWGQTVLHCPYCHGYELRGLPIAVLAGSVHSPHQAAMLPDWGPTTYFSQGLFLPDAEQQTLMDKRGVVVEHCPVVAIEGESPALSAVVLADGRRLAAAVIYLAPNTRLAVQGPSLAEQLGCVLEDGMTGPLIQTDPLKQTSVPGVFAAGDNATLMHNATLASAAGVTAGFAAHRYLMFQS